jgi:hypothetical protein
MGSGGVGALRPVVLRRVDRRTDLVEMIDRQGAF